MKKLFLFSLLFLFACIEKPYISVKDVIIDKIKGEELDFKVKLDIYNPNNFDVELKSASYDVVFDEQFLGTGKWEGGLILPSNKNTFLTLPLTVKKDKLLKFFLLFLSYKLGDKSEFLEKTNIKGKLVIKKSLFSKEIDFDWKYKEKKLNKKRTIK